MFGNDDDLEDIESQDRLILCLVPNYNLFCHLHQHKLSGGNPLCFGIINVPVFGLVCI